MKIGAAALVQAWGRTMSYYRDGVKLFDFKGRRAEIRPEAEQLDYSVDQLNFNIIAAVEDFGDVRPQKFDVVLWDGQNYVVQKGHAAGADEDELIKMHVRGGMA